MWGFAGLFALGVGGGVARDVVSALWRLVPAVCHVPAAAVALLTAAVLPDADHG